MFGNTVFQRMTKTSFETLDDGVMLIRQESLFKSQLSFWFRGAYGNFILGTPQPTKDLMDKLKQLGGVFRIISWQSLLGNDELALFNRFGAHYVTTEVDALNAQIVPVLSWNESPIVGLKFKSFSSSKGKNFFSFSWKNSSYTNIISEKLSHDYFLAADQTIQETGPEAAGSFQASRLNELIQTKGKRIVRAAHNAKRLIILFDDVEFERNDYEVISPKQRKQLISQLEAKGFVHKSGNKLEHPLTNLEVHLSKPPKALGSPIVDDYTTQPTGVNIVTATQGAFIILHDATKTAEIRSTEIKRLLSNIPFNVRKLKMLDHPDGFDKTHWDKLLKDLELMQKEVVSYYRTNRVNGIIGRPKVKEPLTIDTMSLV